jgi:hypothetical protein
MEVNSLNNILSYLSPNKLIEIFNYKTFLVEIFLKYLINKINLVNKKKYSNLTITNYYNFVPLPNTIKTIHVRCKISKDNHFKIFNTKDVILPGNIILPHPNISAIPFTYGFTKNKIYTLVNSSVYYYEIKIDKKPFINDCTKNKCISIGFGSILNSVINQQVGWSKNTIAIHSDDGKLFNGALNGVEYNASFGYNDIIGAGLIYKYKDIYEPFFTINGKLLEKIDNIKLEGFITPQIGFDHILGFQINFGKRPFKFKIMKIINTNTNILSSYNKFVFNGYDKTMFNYRLRRQLKNYINIKSNFKYSLPSIVNNISTSPLQIHGTGINLINQIPNDEENIQNLIQEEINNASSLSNLSNLPSLHSFPPLLSIPPNIHIPPSISPPDIPITPTSDNINTPNISINNDYTTQTQIMNNMLEEISNKLENDTFNINNTQYNPLFNNVATNYFSNLNNTNNHEDFEDFEELPELEDTNGEINDY